MGWEEKWADSYPSSQSSNRHCGNPSCPIQRCGWIPLWPAWAPPPRDRSRQDKKDEKTLSISQTQKWSVSLDGWKCGAQNKGRKRKIRKQVTKYIVEMTFRYIVKWGSCKEKKTQNKTKNCESNKANLLRDRCRKRNGHTVTEMCLAKDFMFSST